MADNRTHAKDVADWCARSLAEAKETGAFDTRCFVQNADLIIAALREYAETDWAKLRVDTDWSVNGNYDFATIRQDLKTA